MNGLQTVCPLFLGEGFALFILTATEKCSSDTHPDVASTVIESICFQKERCTHIGEACYLHTFDGWRLRGNYVA